MPTVVPSQVVDYLKIRYPQADSPDFYLDIDHAPIIAHLLFLVESIPAYLMTLHGVAAAEFGEAISAMRIALARWNASERNYVLKGIPGSRHTHPLAMLRRHLSSLHDEGAEPRTNALPFISDMALRDSLRRDLGSIDQCVQNGEWKAATVLGGSVLEAFLLHGLHEYQQTNTTALQAAIQSLTASAILQGAPPRNLDEWVLHQLTEVSEAVGLIQKETAAQCRIAKAFRNLIHPGRAARLSQHCDRGTALSALAAIEHVIRDLTP